jgi:hypothetical protein
MILLAPPQTVATFLPIKQIQLAEFVPLSVVAIVAFINKFKDKGRKGGFLADFG